jgi:hypothetical protein
MNLRAFDPVAACFEWAPPPGICIEDDSPDLSSRSKPDAESPAAGAALFYLVRYQQGPVVSPWGFDSDGRGRTGIGGCPP